MYRDEDDWMPIWARRRRYPYPERSIFDDIEEQIRETFAYMQREFHELAKRAPKDLHQTRVLSDGSKVEEWGPFVYGYTIKIGPNGKLKSKNLETSKDNSNLETGQLWTLRKSESH
jgi:HSP20 family protein